MFSATCGTTEVVPFQINRSFYTGSKTVWIGSLPGLKIETLRPCSGQALGHPDLWARLRNHPVRVRGLWPRDFVRRGSCSGVNIEIPFALQKVGESTHFGRQSKLSTFGAIPMTVGDCKMGGWIRHGSGFILSYRGNKDRCRNVNFKPKSTSCCN
jgi:hypothetical protein